MSLECSLNRIECSFSEEILISTDMKREISVSLKRILLVKWKYM